MDYIELQCTIEPVKPGSDILIALLSEIDFESFLETENGVLAYIQAPLFSEDKLKNLVGELDASISFSWEHRLIKSENWNSVWESNFQPLLIAGKCSIRASFHEQPENVDYDIVIDPKMSFGTGHHETTSLMVENMLQLSFHGKAVLDMGCGTGILAILADKKGASTVVAIDNDDWAYQNAKENIQGNKAGKTEVLLGDVKALPNRKFDVILANINRNIILRDLPQYLQHLAPQGIILMSGFLEVDIPVLEEKFTEFRLKKVVQQVKNHWALIQCLNS